MTSPSNAAIVNEIRTLYGVVPTAQFDAKRAIEERVTFLANFLRSTGRKALITGAVGLAGDKAQGGVQVGYQLATEKRQ